MVPGHPIVPLCPSSARQHARPVALSAPASTHRSVPLAYPAALTLPSWPWRALTRTGRCLSILVPIFYRRAVGSPISLRLGYARPAPRPNCFITLDALAPRAHSSHSGGSPGPTSISRTEQRAQGACVSRFHPCLLFSTQHAPRDPRHMRSARSVEPRRSWPSRDASRIRHWRPRSAGVCPFGFALLPPTAVAHA